MRAHGVPLPKQRQVINPTEVRDPPEKRKTSELNDMRINRKPQAC